MSPSGPARGPSFTGHDRRRLRRALAQANEVRLFRRIQAVWYVAAGHSVQAAAELADVDRSSVHRWVQIYLETRDPASLADAPRPGRPRQADDLDEELLAELLALDPRTLGYRATSWTAALLARHLREECGCPVSERTLRRRLEEYDWRWKRLRHVYAERDPHMVQKKGVFAAA
jgi:transposase